MREPAAGRAGQRASGGRPQGGGGGRSRPGPAQPARERGRSRPWAEAEAAAGGRGDCGSRPKRAGGRGREAEAATGGRGFPAGQTRGRIDPAGAREAERELARADGESALARPGCGRSAGGADCGEAATGARRAGRSGMKPEAGAPVTRQLGAGEAGRERACGEEPEARGGRVRGRTPAGSGDPAEWASRRCSWRGRRRPGPPSGLAERAGAEPAGRVVARGGAGLDADGRDSTERRDCC
nr:translation initiation factor IF-2-like [Aegilops tauschii subsp. strangulata]